MRTFAFISSRDINIHYFLNLKRNICVIMGN
jgi:hypothetical protein